VSALQLTGTESFIAGVANWQFGQSSVLNVWSKKG